MKSARLCIFMQSLLFQMRMNSMRRSELSRKGCGWMACISPKAGSRAARGAGLPR